MTYRHILLVLLFPLLVLTGCRTTGPAPQSAPNTPTAPPQATGELKIFVPCGMIVPMRAAADAFMKTHPELKVVGVYDNAGIIVKRIAEKGEQGDLMVSPGSTEIGQLEAKGFIRPDSKQALGNFELVCIVPATSKLGISKPADLKKVKTMGAPDPEVNSVGTSGKEALTKLGLWDTLKPKMVFSEHAIEAYTLVASGKADAAICYRNCPLETNPKKLAKSKVRIAFSFPQDSYQKQQCLIGELKDARNPTAARAFVDFISSPDGLKILADNGMTGCLDLAQCPVPTAGAKADTSQAVVKVVAYYPDNEDEDHQAIKKKILGLSAQYGGKVSGQFVDFTSDEGFKKWQEAGLSCGAVLINGQETQSYEKDGKPVEVTFVRAQGGEWTFADLDAVIQKLLKEKS